MSSQETRLSPRAALPRGSRRAPRSCYRCKERKVGCDKMQPCSNCSKAAKQCDYPPPGPRIRRTKKTIMADMASRLSRLEGSAASPGGPEAPPLDPQARVNAVRRTPRARTGQRRAGDASEKIREGVLLQSGSSSQYINEIFLSRVIKNERSIESVLTTPQNSPAQSWVSSPFSAAGILSSPNPSIEPATLHPPRHIAVRLWNIYVSNAAPATGFELLHQPTDEVRVYSTIDCPGTASYDDLAFCFAVYFTAVVSLDEAEAQVILDEDKDSVLHRFKAGLEQALAHGNFLDCPTVTALSAFATYLSVLRVQNRGKGLWILKGLAIRIAQSLGLHRDGARFGLPPFECEMRRRLWWNLLSRDRREGEDYGVENGGNSLILESDVRLPLNIDDADLHPGMTDLPEARAGFTSVSLSLVNIELARAISRLSTLLEASSPSSPPSEENRAAILEEAKKSVEWCQKSCNLVIPQQLLVYTFTGFLLRKLHFISKLQFTLARHGGGDAVPPADFATEENLAEALEILVAYSGDDRLRQFVWVNRAYPQYHVTTYILWHLCLNPRGPCVERAWAAVDAIFSNEIHDGATIGLGSKLSVVTALRTKAMDVRIKSQGQNASGGVDNPQEAHTRDTSVSEFLPVPDPDGPEADSFVDEEWPNWTTLAQGLQFDSSGLLPL